MLNDKCSLLDFLIIKKHFGIKLIYVGNVLAQKIMQVSPELIAQVLRDRSLKTGLLGRRIQTKNGLASHDIQQLAIDPLSFIRLNAISGDNMTKMGKLPPHGRAQLVKLAPNSYAAEYLYEPSRMDPKLAVEAYFLGYNGANQSIKTPAYVDIPIQATENSFLFTGSLTGCSVIVTKLNETTYRVYHDGRVNSSVLYDNVVMAFDFKDYQISGTEEGLAVAYMQFNHGGWQLLLQRQEYEVINGTPTPILRRNSASISALYPNERLSHDVLDKFNLHRNEIHKKLKQIASEFGIDTDNILDGVYFEGEFSLQHPAITPWLNLRDEIKIQIAKNINILNNKIEEINLELTALNRKETHSNEDSIRIAQFKKSIEEHKITRGYYRQKYGSILAEALVVERNWLWLQIKKQHGESSIIQMEDPSIQSGINFKTQPIEKLYELVLYNDIVKYNVKFNEGIEQYDQIVIDGFNDDMSSLEMKELYIKSELSIEKRGALYQHIIRKEKAEFESNILSFTLKSNSLFRDAGGIDQRIAPQDFYLPLMGDNSGGRCYPLVRTMSVALKSEGMIGANKFLNKMFFAAASPEDKNSILLKFALENLHLNIEATQASIVLGTFELNKVKEILVDSKGSNMYALNSVTHSMLLGKTIINDETNYYFYDPNFGIYAFDDPDKLFSALNKFMFENNMAQHYSVVGGQFEMVSIDTEQMSDVQIGSRLTVADLVQSDDLTESIHQSEEVAEIIARQDLIARDKQIQASLAILESERLGERLESALYEVINKHQLDEKWLPVFENVEKLSDDRYRIQFIHQDVEAKTRWIETENATFFEFKEYFHKQIAILKKNYSFNGKELQRKSGIGEAEHVDGLNIAMGIQAIIQWSANRNRKAAASSEQPSNLETALRIHTCISYSMMAHGVINDAAKVGKIAYSLWREGSVAAKTMMNNFSLSLVRMANEGLGILFQGAMVVFDIYELANAQNEAQRAVFGTQLAFDSASLGAGLVGIGASILGAETVAGITGPLSVPIMGVGIGFTALININERHAQKATAVGLEFTAYQQSYQNAAIAYDDEKKLLIPTYGVVIEEINFQRGFFKLGSQYIYRGENMTWTIPHCCMSDFQSAPRADIDRKNAINIREAVGVVDNQVSFDGGQSHIIVLPVVPQSYIRYNYSVLFGGTERNDNGFSILRKMEEDYQFYFDFLYCSAEYIISELVHEYVNTKIQVTLNTENKHLVVPLMPEPWRGHIEHVVKGNGGEYQITVNHGASLRLMEDLSSDKLSQWILDTSLIDDGKELNVSFYDDHIKINGFTIGIDATAKSSLIKVINSKNELNIINFSAQTIEPISLDGYRWSVKGQSIEQHLNELADKHELHGQYVVVNSYQHNGLDVGRAFYDVATKRMLFTNSLSEENQTAELIGVIGDVVYFYSREKAIAWQANVKTGNITHKIEASSVLGSGAEIVHASLEYNQFNITLRQNYLGQKIDSTYRVLRDKLELTKVFNNRKLINMLHNTPTILSQEQRQKLLQHDYLVFSDEVINSSSDLYMPIEPNVRKVVILTEQEQNHEREQGFTYHPEHIGNPSSQTETSVGKIVKLIGTDKGFTYRYWLRSESGTLIKCNLARPDNYDSQLSSQLLRRYSITAEKQVEIDLLLAKPGILLKTIMESSHLGISQEHLIRAENLFKISGKKATLAKVLGVVHDLYDLRSDQWVWQSPEDLILVGSLFNQSGQEVFFFYSRKEDVVFYQEGLGQDIIEPNNPTALRLNFRQIENVINWQNNILIIQDDGTVKQLNADGTADTVALNKNWFNKSIFKWSNFNQFSNEKHPIALFGLKGADGKRILPAWYLKGKIIISPSFSSESELQIMGFDDAKQQGIIFDTKSKKLYQVKAIDSAQFDRIFDQNRVMIHPENLPEYMDLYPNLSFKSVKKIAGGLMLQIDSDEIIYHPILQNNKQLSSSLIIKGTRGDDNLKLEEFRNTFVLIISLGEGSDTYNFEKADWQYYKAIIINNYSADRVVDRLVLPIEAQLGDIYASRQGEDLIITDPINNTSLCIYKAYSSQADSYRHLQIQIGETEQFIDISILAERPQVRHGLMYLSAYFNEQLRINDEIALLGGFTTQMAVDDGVNTLQKLALGQGQRYSDTLLFDTVNQH